MVDRRFEPDALKTPEGAAWGPVGTSRGDIEAGAYEGPETHVQPPWKCPNCKTEQTGRLEDGCVSCGSGSARARHVGIQRPTARPAARPTVTTQVSHEAVVKVEKTINAGLAVYEAAMTWATYNTQATLMDAFVAGYRSAQRDGMKMAEPPPAPAPQPANDLRLPEPASYTEPAPPAKTWNPETKGARTIVAALEHFRDTILVYSDSAIESGEWCTVDEVNDLIRRFQERS